MPPEPVLPPPRAPLEIDLEGLASELRMRVDGEVRFDVGSRALYTTDASNYRQVPLGVVLPRTPQAVIDTHEVCRRYGAPILSRGGGTALSGQTCNVAVVIDFSKYMNRTLEIDAAHKVARVQPGLILDHLREEAEAKHNLTFGPDPATHTHCTFGGMLGNNSCGIHSVMAGRTVDNVEDMEVLTYDGLRMRVGPTSEAELGKIIAGGGRRGEIYHKLCELATKYAPLIRARYPKIPRRVSGYSLDELLPEKGFNVARALVGTESTCVTILEATVRLVDHPRRQSLLVLGYSDVFEAADHVPQVLECGPIGLEGVDELLVQFMKQKHLHPEDAELLPEGRGWLIVEFGGDTKEEADAKATRTMTLLRRQHRPPSMKLYDDPKQEARVWEIRESGLGATANVPGLPLSWPGWEDAAVPPEKVGAYLREFRKLLDAHGLKAALYGHFGDGCIHCRITFDMFTREGVSRYMRFIDEASDLVVRYGGSFSAEHGDGQSKAIFLPKMYGPELVQAFREFKAVWDPDNKMNPGKIVEPYRPDENLRLGPDYTPWQPDTHFSFPEDDGSFSRATLRCVGVGKCRRTHHAFMCPSFLATREEMHTTRGRSRMLFEMFHGGLVTDRWRSKAVRESLDMCLGCKACKSECPVNVDMDRYKSEFLAHHYHRRLRPPAHYSMGLVGYLAPLGGMFPRLSNFIARAPLLGSVMKAAAGISQRRSMPAFARQNFIDWFLSREGIAHGGRPVMVFPDLFNDYFFPQTLKAAVHVLEQWGYHPMLPPRRPPAIRPLLHFGWLPLARRKLMGLVKELHPFIASEMPIIVLEPSTASVFRDELPLLLPADEDARRLSTQVRLLDEFIVDEKLLLPKLGGRAIFHAHCHQKAVLRSEAAREVLRKMDLEVEEPQPGCCGMAGAFGMESRHYEASMKIAEERLLPAVRGAASEAHIVVEGFSCRTQIRDGTGREPLHIAELIKLAFDRQSAARTKTAGG